jgi:hypothetical protein
VVPVVLPICGNQKAQQKPEKENRYNGYLYQSRKADRQKAKREK